MSHSNFIGDIAELKVASDIMSHDFFVSVPFGHGNPYDLIGDTGSKLFRVQVKSVRLKNGAIEIKNTTTHTTGGGLIVFERYDDDAYDVMAAYCPDTEQVYYINNEDIKDKSSLTLRIEPTKNNQAKGIKWAKDYQLLQL